MSAFKDEALAKITNSGGRMKVKHLVTHLMHEFLLDRREAQKGLKLMRKQNMIAIANGNIVSVVED